MREVGAARVARVARVAMREVAAKEEAGAAKGVGSVMVSERSVDCAIIEVPVAWTTPDGPTLTLAAHYSARE